MNCARNGCQCEATHNPKVMVPTKRWFNTHDQSYGAILSLPLCMKHTKEFNAKEFLDTPGQKGVPNRAIFEFMAKGKKKPLFDHAYILPIPFDSKEAVALREQHAAEIANSAKNQVA